VINVIKSDVSIVVSLASHYDFKPVFQILESSGKKQENMENRKKREREREKILSDYSCEHQPLFFQRGPLPSAVLSFA